jgi:hypothetical protein
MGLSNYALGMIGFEKIPEDTPLEVRFHSLNVYEIRGITSNNESPLNPDDLKREKSEISVSIGDSLNAVCRKLTGDDFADDEEKWRDERKSKPPYLMVLTSLPESAVCSTGYWKKETDSIVTHDCFTASKEALLQLEKEKTTSFVTGLSAALSTPDNPVIFIPIARKVYGTTPDNLTVRDIRFTGSAEIYVARPFAHETLTSSIDAALNTNDNIHSKVGYFFDLAIREKDNLKKFLYYFLVIEVHTHQVFKSLDYPSLFSTLNNVPDRVKSEATNLLITYQADAKNLSHRFIWCTLLKWEDITDEDIKQFKILKKIRDKIYHGEEVDMKNLPLSQAQKLALKLIRNELIS